jgi:hypothetical protein
MSCIHITGRPKRTSLKVPPPTEVTKAMIKMPKASMRFLNEDNTPDIEKATTPKMSIIKM